MGAIGGFCFQLLLILFSTVVDFVFNFCGFCFLLLWVLFFFLLGVLFFAVVGFVFFFVGGFVFCCCGFCFLLLGVFVSEFGLNGFQEVGNKKTCF